MAALIQFVDSIDADPTVRLDLNDGLSWFCRLFKAPPPRLRRSESENSMRDGGIVGSSSYGNRTLELDLTLVEEGEEEWAADEMQKLWRELDRPSNFLRYWPEGLDKPVFFRTFRSDVSELEELWTTPIARNIALELLAEPAALGLKETLGPFTVSNDPLASTNPCGLDITGVLGDIAAPVVLWDSATGSTTRGRLIGSAHTVAPIASTWYEAESMTLGTDTTNPGGAPDTAMTGSGATNYVRTSFASPAMTPRITWSTSASTPRGRWRVLGFFRRNGATSVLRVQMNDEQARVVPDATGSRLVVDLGLVSFYEDGAYLPGYAFAESGTAGTNVTFSASRDGGTDTLEWDGFMLVPAGSQAGEVEPPTMMFSELATARGVWDGLKGNVAAQNTAGDPTAAGGILSPGRSTASGAFPTLAPGATVNRLAVIPYAIGSFASGRTVTDSVSLAYWPRYLFVRPSSS